MDTNLLQEAARRAQGPDPTSARPLIAQLLGRRPDDANALTLLGLVAQRTGDGAGALAAFARARAADPDNPARLGNHALALKDAGRFDEAIAALRRALEIRPAAAVTLANLGSCLIAADRAAEAEAPLRRAVAVKPDHAEAWNNLGIALARTGRPADSDAAYGRALELRPGWIEARLNRADARLALGDRDGADAIVRAVRAEDPAHPRAANILAGIVGTDDEAIMIYRDALDRGGFNHPLASNLAMALLRAGRHDAALAVTERLLRESPNVTTPLALACVALERLGRADEVAALNRFVTVRDIASVLGFATLEGFHAALDAELRAHPSLTHEPEGLVTRGGRQSDDLAHARTPALATLADLARDALARRHAALAGSDHPWLRARPAAWSLTLWGTILAPGGAVDAHIHAPNWLSGVYYPALPAGIAAGEEGGFAIGTVPQALGGGGTIHRIAPRAGRMILFPSFLWHATLPFGGTEDRLSFAFDLVPQGIGRPHRLKT